MPRTVVTVCSAPPTGRSGTTDGPEPPPDDGWTSTTGAAAGPDGRDTTGRGDEETGAGERNRAPGDRSERGRVTPRPSRAGRVDRAGAAATPAAGAGRA